MIIMEIPFIIIRNNKDKCFEGEVSACPHISSLRRRDSAVITFSGLSHCKEDRMVGMRPPERSGF